MQFRSLRVVALLAAALLVPVSGYSQTNYGIWITAAEVANLPMSGIAWDKLKAQADADAGVPNLSDQNQNNNVYVLAKALVYARTGIEKYRTEVIDQCMRAIDTEVGGSGLALGRELAAYVIAADLVKLPADKNQIFRAWLRRTLTEPMLYSGRSLQQIHELRPNNWGLMAGSSRAAVAAYLNDSAEMAAAAKVFRGWLGERNVYSGFYSDPATEEQSWICDRSKPVGINPAGCTINGHDVDGVLPYDQGRGGPFTWPPFDELYVWEALKGVIVQAEIYYRAGYDVYNWSDKAVNRAYRWMYYVNNFPPDSTDLWQPFIVNFRYGTKYPTTTSWARFGDLMGWADWTHGPARTLSIRATDPPSDATPPTAPANLTSTAAGGTQINLSWMASTDNVGVTGYRLERCQGVGCTSFAQIASLTGTAYSNTGLTAGTSYSYKVRAADAAGNLSGYSNTASATTPTAAPPPPPPPTYTTLRVEQNNTAVKYSGTWYNNIYSKHSGGSAAKSPYAGSRATFTFTGNAVSWIGYRDYRSGIANVYLDGNKVAEIDTYSVTAMIQPVVYSRTGLTYGTHILIIEATGRRNPASGSPWIWVDRFDYTTINQSTDTAPSTSAVRTAAVVAVGDVGSFQVGQAPIHKTDDVPAPAGGFATLRFGNGCSVQSEAGIIASPLTDSGRIYIEQDAKISTGIAFANPNDQVNTIEYFLLDENGQTIGRSSFDLPAQGQLARFSSEAPFVVPTVWKGTLTFSSTLPVATTAVRSYTNERGDYLFTTITTADLSPLRQDPVLIPQFVDGGAWTNQMILVNPADSVISGTVEFVGTDIPSVPYTIASGGALKLQTPTQSDRLRVGAVRIVPTGSSASPAATSILSFKVGGVTMSEVSLPGVDIGRGFTLFAEKGTNLFAGAPGSAETGLAVVNTGEDTVLQFELMSGGRTFHTGQLALSANAHRSLYLSQIPGLESVTDGFQGVLRVTSTSSDVSVIGVRTGWDECGDLAFSSVPAINDDLIHPNSRYVFPHFAFGSGFSARFVIFENPAGQPGSLDFFSSSGAVLTPPQ